MGIIWLNMGFWGGSLRRFGNFALFCIEFVRFESQRCGLQRAE